MRRTLDKAWKKFVVGICCSQGGQETTYHRAAAPKEQFEGRIKEKSKCEYTSSTSIVIGDSDSCHDGQGSQSCRARTQSNGSPQINGIEADEGPPSDDDDGQHRHKNPFKPTGDGICVTNPLSVREPEIHSTPQGSLLPWLLSVSPLGPHMRIYDFVSHIHSCTVVQ